ncbi:hypothetical protein APF79_08215 [bacterium BRH_c32]|nr:MAG: hypothetical protein APF79_08215 [bacterium BRH_c32]
MLTVLESIQKTTDYLAAKGIELPRLNAELMLAEILNCKRLDLYLAFDKPLKENETKIYRDWIARRGKYEPLQYIIGHVDFYDCKIYVNKNVLIPRQETEILVETVLNSFGIDKELKILDIGTGSGAIAIALAKKMNQCNFNAIDISETALETAKKNSVFNNVENISFRLLDIKEKIPNDYLENFDLIVSNPPYVSKNEYDGIQKEIKSFEPRIAVTDNGDGYEFYELISKKANTLLKSGGAIYFEVGIGQSEKVSHLLKDNQFTNIKIYQDLQKINRVVSGTKL